MKDIPTLSFFALRNRDGQWFRRKGYGGYGPSWVDDVQKARIYTKIGQARGQVTYWVSDFPEFGVPDIVEFTANATKVHSEAERVKKTLLKAQIRQLERKLVRHIPYEENRDSQIRAELHELYEKLEEMNNG